MSLEFDMADPAARPRGLDAAASAARRGDLVVLPTDTVYGLATDAFNPRGVAAIRAAKGRGRDLPLQVLVGSPDTVEGLGYGLTKAARELVQGFWPGGLTLVVRQQPTLAWDLGDSSGTVALRMPLHPVAIELLRITGPLAVSGANAAGGAPAASLSEAREQLGDLVAIYLDGGPSLDAVPSTVVDVSGQVPRLLRPGAIDLDTLRTVCPEILPG
ncbi:L-threonylcarbamoyladenylate synthase [Longivirga aurantiaca]|uniref:L-threonylcarbamoyladenylate synthase n=1 Tax=Longivirga aurantiaca TaxID=1837743 RepID=A0ABW1T041_9ACTN